MSVRRLVVLSTLLASLAMPAASAYAAPPEQCSGDAIEPDKTIAGEFDAERQGSFVFVPFEVPDGTTAVRVKYCFDQPEAPTSAAARNTIDLGLYEPRDPGERAWGVDEFRGWGGSGYPDVTVSPQGFASERLYRDDPDVHVPGKTTRSFRPGPIPGGEWAVELGLAAIAPRELGNLDGKVGYRVEIELRDDPAFADNPYRPKRYDTSPAREDAAWYAGDFHVHAEHSGDSSATMTDTFDFAFDPADGGGAGLDFITLADHNTDTAWGEIGRYQDDYPGKLVIRSQEVTTYRGHANQHASGKQVDYRTGPLLERQPDGSLVGVRPAVAPRRFLDDVEDAEGFSQVNHPTIFPSTVPLFALLCRGCSWDYSDEDTDYSKVAAIEIATGPPGLQGPVELGPNPFTTTGIDFWENKLAKGHKLAAVGSSDSHDEGSPDSATEAPIGTATTAVYAQELSEQGIRCAVEAGHTYVKVFGNDGPDVRLKGRRAGSSGRAAIMGDTIAGRDALFKARVLGGSGTELVVLKDNAPVAARAVDGDDFTFEFESSGPGRYRLQLQRGSSIETVSSPIYVEPGAQDEPEPCLSKEEGGGGNGNGGGRGNGNRNRGGDRDGGRDERDGPRFTHGHR